MTIQIRLLTDPASPWSWGAEPYVRRLEWEFGDGLSLDWVMRGLARSYDARSTARQPAEWLEAAATSGMPIDARIWTSGPISSTYPACMAVKAAAEQGPVAERAYLRRLREGLMVERRKLDHPEALVAEAGAVGLDVARFRIDLGSHAILEAFGADLERAAGVPDLDQIRSYDDLRRLATGAGAEPAAEGRPGALEAVERFGRLATREVEEVSGMPAPVCRAELWALARDWKLRPIPVPTGGELWERA